MHKGGSESVVEAVYQGVGRGGGPATQVIGPPPHPHQPWVGGWTSHPFTGFPISPQGNPTGPPNLDSQMRTSPNICLPNTHQPTTLGDFQGPLRNLQTSPRRPFGSITHLTAPLPFVAAHVGQHGPVRGAQAAELPAAQRAMVRHLNA